MEWLDNMSSNSTPEIKPDTRNNFTCVTFQPDLQKFGLTKLTPDIISLMKKRVYDLAGILNGKVNVFLNGEKIKIKTFCDYVDLYLPKES